MAEKEISSESQETRQKMSFLQRAPETPRQRSPGNLLNDVGTGLASVVVVSVV